MSDWRDDLLGADRIAFDIELRDTETLLCCGFAASADKAYVFTEQRRDEIEEILLSDVPKLAHNAIFDAYWIYSRWNLRVRNITDDSMLAWHSCYPELAGSSDQKSYKASEKGLSFLASLYTNDAYWKDYDVGDAGMYELNGLDCMITYDIMQQLDEEIDRLGVRDIYEQEVNLIWPCVEMQDRGLKVDEEERKRRLGLLRGRVDELTEEINELALPIIKDRKERFDGLEIGQTSDAWSLFEQQWTCPCCRGGSKKRISCVDCAGIGGSGSNGGVLKSDLVEWAVGTVADSEEEIRDRTKGELRELVPACEVCDGEGKREYLEFNPTSHTQVKALLYEGLKLPRRYNDGTLSTDEGDLKSILGEI